MHDGAKLFAWIVIGLAAVVLFMALGSVAWIINSIRSML